MTTSREKFDLILDEIKAHFSLNSLNTDYLLKINLKAKPSAKKEKIQIGMDGVWLLWIKAAPVEGRANEAIQVLLSTLFNVSKTSVRQLKGMKSKLKAFEISIGAKKFDPIKLRQNSNGLLE